MRGAASTRALAIRRWWPVPVILASSLTVQKLLFESRYDVSGHAAGHLDSATGINDKGEIVGFGEIDGETHAFLMETAVPEPASIALLGAGVLGLGLIRKRW